MSTGDIKLRVRRQTRSIDSVTPVSVTVELVLIVDYAQWSMMSSHGLGIFGLVDHMTNVLLYFVHMVEIVSICRQSMYFIASCVSMREDNYRWYQSCTL